MGRAKKAKAVIRVGCCGFAASRRDYFSRLRLVEVQQTFYQPPKVATATRWREEAGADFVFTMKAWQLITHEPSSPTYRRLAKPIPPDRQNRFGSFRDTEEVWEAWETTDAIAEALGARIILFQTPARFTPTAEHRAALLRFFARVPRKGRLFAFEPRGVWEADLVGALCKELDLLHAVDPLRDEPATGMDVAYFRLHGPVTGRYRYDDADLHALGEKCARGGEIFCLFNNPEMWKDALRFSEILSA
jgi:uncharacterized protein YecE (DUF72 family)